LGGDGTGDAGLVSEMGIPLGDEGQGVGAREEEIAWRCVRAKPKAEHLAARRLSLLEGVEAFSPQIRFQKPTRRGKVWFQEALFPGYVFCRFDLWESFRLVNATPGVTGLVKFGGRYPVLSDQSVEAIRQEMPEDRPLEVRQLIEVGDEVEVVEGPLRGHVAYVTALPSARDRVKILLEFLGQQREVEVPLMSLLGFRDARLVARSRPA
jgi:transcriptional antiterminator RfaH